MDESSRRSRVACGTSRVVARWKGAARREHQDAFRVAAGEAAGRRYARASPGAEGQDGFRAARGAARAGARRLLLGRSGRPGSGEHARPGARRRQGDVFERRAGCDGAAGREARAAAALGERSREAGRPGSGEDRSRLGSGLVIRFDVVTLFPEMFSALTAGGITARALQRRLWRLETWNPRDFTTDPYPRVGDRPYGRGAGTGVLG